MVQAFLIAEIFTHHVQCEVMITSGAAAPTLSSPQGVGLGVDMTHHQAVTTVTRPVVLCYKFLWVVPPGQQQPPWPPAPTSLLPRLTALYKLFLAFLDHF